MAKFLVDLEVNVGGYEKSIHHLIEADTKQQAMLQAMANESHSNANMDDTENNEGVWWDLGGEFSYCVSSCKEVSDEVAKVLTDNCFHISQYDPEYILEMIADDAEIRDIELLLKQL